MDAQGLRNLQEAYLEVYKLDEGWKPVNVTRVRTRMGNLERNLSSVSNDRYSDNTPEYARYQRTADVVSQSNRNPNKPFQKPAFDPGGLKPKPGGGFTRSPERNPQWEPFSSRLPKTNQLSASKSSSSTRTKPQVVNPFTNRLTTGRSGNGTFSDRRGDYATDLRTRGSFSGGRGGGSSSLSNLGRASGGGDKLGKFKMTVGHKPGDRYGIGGVGLADEYDLYDLILSHLLDEGYAETPEAAEAIMVNMSEEWRQSIIG